MRTLISIVLFLFALQVLWGQIGNSIPEDRLPMDNGRIAWLDAGFFRNLDGRLDITKVIDLTLSDLNATDDADDTSLIIQALSNADPEGFTILILPEGRIYLEKQLYQEIPSRILIKGKGSNRTSLIFRLPYDGYTVDGESRSDHQDCIKIYGKDMIGIEDLRIVREDYPSGNEVEKAQNYGITVRIRNSSNCWLSGVESAMAARHHIELINSHHCEIRGCYIHEAYDYGDGGYGYGVIINRESTYNLVENNIFRILRHAMIFENDAHYNVFGYNYSIENFAQDMFFAPADMCLHGQTVKVDSGPYFNLYEGNIGQHIKIDDAHGNNGFFNTFFRNKAANLGIWITDNNKKQNIINNYMISDSFLMTLTGFPWRVDKRGDHFSGNNRTKTQGFLSTKKGWESKKKSEYWNDISYYYQEKPAFLEGYDWPFDPLEAKLPAKSRYHDGTFTESLRNKHLQIP